MTTKRSPRDQSFLRYPAERVDHDPTGDTVVFSFPLRGTAPTVFVSGSWETDSDGVHIARVLIGPAAAFVPVANVIYDVWIKVTDNPEIPFKKIDMLVMEPI